MSGVQRKGQKRNRAEILEDENELKGKTATAAEANNHTTVFGMQTNNSGKRPKYPIVTQPLLVSMQIPGELPLP